MFAFIVGIIPWFLVGVPWKGVRSWVFTLGRLLRTWAGI
ncbi:MULTISPECIES: hypothetical protein [unclassified Meridianimarinicoccus]|nr:hypothetical protein [Fluviibacterium sp. MJW13]